MSPQLAHGLLAAQQQFPHDGQLHLVHAEPLVHLVPVLGNSPAALHLDNRPHFPQVIDRLLHVVCVQVHLRRTVALLVAAGDEGVERHRIRFRRRFGFLNQHAHHAALPGVQRMPLGLRLFRRR